MSYVKEHGSETPCVIATPVMRLEVPKGAHWCLALCVSPKAGQHHVTSAGSEAELIFKSWFHH